MGKVLIDHSMSLDGLSTGPNVGVEHPMGDGGEQLRHSGGAHGPRRRAAARDQAPEPLRGLRPRKVGAVSATVLDTAMSPSERPPTEEAR